MNFNLIPQNLRVPSVFVEFDASRAQQTSGSLQYRALIIGQKLSGGAWTANTVNKASSVDQVIAGAGRGSMLHRQALAFFANNRDTEVWFLVLADDAGGTQASGTITVTGPATAAGTIALYIGGVRITVAVASGDAQNTIAGNINSAINAAADLIVTSTVSTNVVTITCRHKGVIGNDVDIRLNYQDGESTPAGVSLAIVAMASGATNPTLTTALAALGDTWYQGWAFGYADATSLSAIEGELLSRDGPMRSIDAVAFTAKSDTVSNMATLGNGRNSPYVSILHTNSSPTPAFEYAAAVLGVVMISVAADVGLPFQTLPVALVQAPAQTSQSTNTERNTLLYDGISTTIVVGGVVQLERLITTYKTTGTGVADTAYLDVVTRFKLQYLRFTFRSDFGARYARVKLANDGAQFAAGQAVLTPKGAKAAALAWFRAREAEGLVQDFDTFKALLVVEIAPTDPNRLNFKLPVDLTAFLATTAAQVAFQI